ncbi:TIGR01777 family oxidoreductase [Endozoicomonas gorgoniicola]|uniref:TIGR01777 family oxidoreductase n=1 Tax=Endozoicomonas gorgoniicola TaxID=1234144 RepID=A0ABT3MQ73_9GAMM|nr:TIGR01777 family oxidoreductase [Endozoicomonas gorgoniicola]MCW7551263.1 TIGR01777 family oxidoreductase [Endozoicomonas gorgoniicola]
MQILMTGGTGFIGRRVVRALIRDGHRVSVLSRQSPSDVRRLLTSSVRPVQSLNAINPSVAFDAIINLAGEPIMAKRWSHQRKRLLLDSRVGLTGELVDLIERLENRPKTLISCSAVGYYGHHDASEPQNESSTAGSDFAASLCERWEQAARRAESLGVRVCVVRTGLVLHQNKGALHEMLPPFRLGLGGPIGSGNQMMSWIHSDDMTRVITFLLNNESLKGAFNATSPNPVSNREFARALGRALRRPAVIPVPAIVLKLLLGESSAMVTHGQAAIPERLQEAGFTWEQPEINSALRQLLIKPSYF